MQTSSSDLIKSTQIPMKYFIMFIIGFVTIGLIFINTGDAKTIYHPLTPAAQQSFNVTSDALCNAERVLAGSKLMDYANNALKLNPEDLAGLAQKRDQTCTF